MSFKAFSNKILQTTSKPTKGQSAKIPYGIHAAYCLRSIPLLAKENTREISEAIVNQWIKRLHQINAPKTVSDKVSYLRKFLRYLQYKGYVVFMPDCPKTSDSYMPYVFSEEEIQDTFIQCRPMV